MRGVVHLLPAKIPDMHGESRGSFRQLERANLNAGGAVFHGIGQVRARVFDFAGKRSFPRASIPKDEQFCFVHHLLALFGQLFEIFVQSSPSLLHDLRGRRTQMLIPVSHKCSNPSIPAGSTNSLSWLLQRSS